MQIKTRMRFYYNLSRMIKNKKAKNMQYWQRNGLTGIPILLWNIK